MSCTADLHDTLNAYVNYHCQCEEACRASARYAKRLRWDHAKGIPRLVSVIGTRRRIRALCAIGWRFSDLAEQVGEMSPQAVGMLSQTRRPQVQTRTAARFADVYDQLWNTPGPSQDCRDRAARKNWPPPLFWDDDLIDDPQYQGEAEFAAEKKQFHRFDGPVSRARIKAEQRARIVALSDKGMSAAAIADQLGCSTRQVDRIRAALRTLDDMREAS